MKDLQWYRRQEKMDAIEHEFGLTKKWQEKFISDMSLLIPKTINNHYIVSDVWFDIVCLDRAIPEVKTFVKCSDRVPIICTPFNQMVCAGFDMLECVKDYDDERKSDYLNCITESFRKELTTIIMSLIEFLNEIDKENEDGETDRCFCSF